MSETQEVARISAFKPPRKEFASGAIPRPSRMSRIRTAAHSDLVTTIVSSFGVFGCFALQGIFIARLLGPERRAEYGTVVLYTQALTYTGLVGTLLSIAAHATRGRQLVTNLRRSAVRLGSVTGVVTAVIVAILALTALPAEKSYLAPLCIVCALMLPLDHIRLTLLAVDHGRGNFSRYNRNLLFNAAALPLMLCGLWAMGIRSLVTIVVATLLVPIASLVYRFGSEGLGIIGPKVDPPIRGLLREGMPYAFAQTSSDLFNRLDAILILWLASLKDQGYYAAAISAAGLLFVTPNALALFSFRSGARSEGPTTLGRVIATGAGVLAIQFLTAGALLVVLEPLIVFVFGASFRGAVPYARILLLAQAIGGLTYVSGGYLRGRRKSFVEVWSRVAGTAVIVAAALALRSSWREMSVPIATIFGQTTCVLILCWAVLRDVTGRRRECPKSLEALTT